MKTKNVLILMGILGGLAIVIVLSIYVYNFGSNEISSKAEAWGQFGDYMGGLLNPVVGFLAFVALLWTIYQNQTELSYAREELRRSGDALQKNNEISENTNKREIIRIRKEDILKVIQVVYEEIKEQYDKPIPSGIIGRPKDGTIKSQTITLKRLFGLEKENAEKHISNSGSITQAIYQIVDLISQLKEYLEELEELSDTNFVSNYYKKYFINHVEGLEKLGFIKEEVSMYYKKNRVIRGRANLVASSSAISATSDSAPPKV